MLIRTHDAGEVNRILNHPAVRPFVADETDGVLDISERVSNQNNVTLIGEYGAFVCIKYDIGIYEVHTAILPDGRGRWAMDFARDGALYMFTATDCVEILTRVPMGHVAAKALTEAMGFRPLFTTPPECRFRGELVPCHIYTLSLQEWFARAHGMAEAGASFHRWLNEQVGEGVPHGDDPAHNRIVGVTLAMITGGQVLKGLAFYNRAAFVTRHQPIALLNGNPIQIKFDAGVLTLKDGGIRYERAH